MLSYLTFFKELIVKQSELIEKLIAAQFFANIVLTFTRRAMPSQINSLVTILEHFQRNGLFELVDSSEANNTITVCKTFLFTDRDATAFAEIAATHITNVEVRTIPAHSLSLIESDGCWQLKLEGGNKLMRAILFLLPEVTAEYGLDSIASNPVDSHGIVTVDLHSDEGTVLDFAQHAAALFRTELQLNF